MIKKALTVTAQDQIKDFKKTINVDSDKSISIRSFLIGAISHNLSKVKNVLESEDVFSCISCLQKLGVKIIKSGKKEYLIYGKGLGSFIAKNNTILNCGNSGTVTRLLIGILSTNPNINVKITGDNSLKKRNMSKLFDIMVKFGTSFYPKNKKNLPITLVSSEMPIGINYKAGVSAQLKSATILAGLNSYGTTEIVEEAKSRNATENMLSRSNKVIEIKKNKKKQNIIKINGKKYLKPLNSIIPADPSSAAFFTALTLMKKRSNLIIKNVGLNERRIGFYNLLKKHGAKINFKNKKTINDEPIGDIHVKSSKLKPIKASAKFYPSTTDEYPILFIVSSLIPGTSIFKGIKDLANKESNRIEEIKKILQKANIKCKSSSDEMQVFGVKKINLTKKVITIPNLGDHRICMSAIIFALLTGVKIKIKNFETVYTSSPSFLKIIKSLGGHVKIR
ncbi:MAG: 3-phosphoshikimate 1-carboxyvinyltransferase [Pelagibacteraceae bacterium]